ncbi:MAG TPA: protein kinase [Kofleriaceae bacterium]|nr:protein kinase [Kofleriaceae bacterium]
MNLPPGSSASDLWAAPVPFGSLIAADLARPGVVFEHGGYLYRTTGKTAGQGGMGNTYLLAYRPVDAAAPPTRDQAAVAKVFHGDYLRGMKSDPVVKRDAECAMRCLNAIARLEHPNVLPLFLAEPIVDNHLVVTPLQAGTLRQVVRPGCLSQRRRVELLTSALRGLHAIHEAGFIHRDFTVHNVLVGAAMDSAYVFDFDLALAEEDYRHKTYRELYQGRLIGSPGYSVAPETLESTLMDAEVTPLVDVFAVGGALFALFTDEMPYGRTDDMWSLLLRVSEGAVLDGRSRVVYPDSVPRVLRPIIERCLERNPDRRYAGVDRVILELEGVMSELARDDLDDAPPVFKTMRFGDPDARVSAVYEARADPSVTRELVSDVSGALDRLGYELRRAMGRVKDHAIFMAAPRPDLIARGEFRDTNTYPKLVTAIPMEGDPDPERTLDLWVGGYLPILRQARQGLLTPLYRVVHDQAAGLLLLFSEYVDDVRFGPELDHLDMSLEEVFGLGYLVTRQVRRLHARGMAHNNVCADSLLLKALRTARRAHPAMVGIVAPSFSEADMAEDVRRLALLVLSWLRPDRIQDGEAIHRARLADVHRRLEAAADGANTTSIDDLVAVVADGLSVIDYNFGVLRETEGDLDAYALLLFSPTLYGRLWGLDR